MDSTNNTTNETTIQNIACSSKIYCKPKTSKVCMGRWTDRQVQIINPKYLIAAYKVSVFM